MPHAAIIPVVIGQRWEAQDGTFLFELPCPQGEATRLMPRWGLGPPFHQDAGWVPVWAAVMVHHEVGDFVTIEICKSVRDDRQAIARSISGRKLGCMTRNR